MQSADGNAAARGFNPYVEDLFVGRTTELTKLGNELTRGRSTLAAVMGGRGMGKTSFARELERVLHQSDSEPEVIRWASTPSDPSAFYEKLSRSLSVDITGTLFDDELREAIEARPRLRTILIFDEVDAIIDSPRGRAVFEGIRIAWEQLGGRLGVVILGGSGLWELLRSNVSPFLGRAVFVHLRGLSLDETRQLVEQPSGLEFDGTVIDLLWQETTGHPAVITELMKSVFDRALRSPLAAIDEQLATMLETRYFPTWWDNLRPEGQSLYRKLVEFGRPVPRERVPGLLKGPANEWIRVLETTGVAVLDQGEILPRGELFGRWARREHFFDSGPTDVSTESEASFEQRLSIAIGRWSAGVIEYAGLGLLLKPGDTPRGNERLLPEAHFQLSLLLALQQLGLQVEAEGWSGEGRTDLKVMERKEGGKRATIELKIWGRNHDEHATKQVLGYAQPRDDFAAVVTIDRQANPLRDRYESRMLALGYRLGDSATDAGLFGPQFVTEHSRSTGTSIRVHHYLVQLPSD